MKSFRDMLLAIGESKHTANFQKLCGIRTHKVGGQDLVNGTIAGNHAHENGHTTNDTSRSNGAFCSNGSAVGTNGSAKTSPSKRYSNGHISNSESNMCNGTNHNFSHKNGKATSSHVTKNGYIKSTKKHENGISVNDKTLAVLEELSSTNGHNSLRLRHGKVKPDLDEYDSSLPYEKSADVCPKYTIENRLLYYIFSFGASLGNEIFYVLFFSFTLWNVDNFLVRKMSIAWVVVMYLGQAAKDIIRWPRPNSPPVVRLEERYELEYGMPSTHAMVGIAIPFGLLYWSIGRYEFTFIYGVLFAVTWSILVSFSRLYLGMHSCLDILAGIVLAFVIMVVTHPIVDATDTFIMSHPYAVPTLIAVCSVLCLMYPSLDRWSTARGDTFISLAVFSGVYAGMSLTGTFTDVVPEPDSPPYVLGVPDLNSCLCICVRQIIGVIIIMVFLTGFKALFLQLLCALWGLDPKDPESKKWLKVEFPYKYVSYFLGSAGATFLVPMLFLKLNIDRPGYYSEIFNTSHG